MNAADGGQVDAFGRFRVLHQIGAGALGPVYRAFDPERDRLVAVKVFRLDVPPERMHQLVAHLERLASGDLQHPAVAAPLAAGTDGIVAYLASEFVPAASLDVVVRDEGAAAPAEALRIAERLAEALDFAAAVGVCHGALHPRDVLLGEDEARITGLGVAQAIERAGASAPIRRPYAAPERAAGAPWTCRADVFSLAALVHELLWSRRIVGLGAEAAASLTALPGAALDRLRETFARALAERPEDRFETALEFAAALKASFPDVMLAPGASARGVGQAPRQGSLYDGLDDGAPAALPPDPFPHDWSSGAADSRPRLADAGAADGVSHAPGESTPVVDEPLDTTGRGGAKRGRFDEIGDVTLAAVDEPPLEADAPTLIREVPPFEPALLYADDAAAPSAGDAHPPPAEESTVDALREARPSVADFALQPPAFESFVAEEAAGRTPLAEESLAGARTDDSLAAAAPPAPGPVARARVWPAVAVAFVLGSAGGWGVGYLAGVHRAATRTPGPAVGASAPARNAASVASRGPDAPPEAERASAQGGAVALPGAAGGRAAPDREPERQDSAPSADQPRVQEPAAARAQAGVTRPATGRILVRSTPAGAVLYLDGRERGRTPATIQDVPLGVHHLRVVRGGYGSQTRRIVLTTARPSESLIVALDPVPAAASRFVEGRPAPGTPATVGSVTGTVDVESRPAGARVFLDGREVGMTPLSLTQIRAGEHVIRLERDGYRGWSSAIRVMSGVRHRVTASLDR